MAVVGSLERILEDAHLSGELKLSGRKLKDIPKAAGKYNLSDTVFADLSRNRFCELPEDVTSFPFLETLLVYHNAIRSIPETVKGLHSLTYLDLRSNQLCVLPREICLLPLKVLLVGNNRLSALPEELGRMEKLTELDAACNQISHLPARMGDLRSLRSLSLRNNMLVYLPREVTTLQLVSLDVSCNRIATLPVELRQMTSLVDLELDNNPLTSPPASLCVRGLVHVFKYLETVAVREGRNIVDGNATLRRSAVSQSMRSSTDQRQKRIHVDSGYSTTSDNGDKRWSNDDNSPKRSPVALHVKPTDPVNLSPSNGDDHKHVIHIQEKHVNSIELSPEAGSDDGAMENGVNEKKHLANVQTYREYKEALRQQRSQDATSVYRSKEHTPTTPSPNYNSSSQSSPISPQHSFTSKLLNNTSQMISNQNADNNKKASPEETTGSNRRPIQKVTPSRNVCQENGVQPVNGKKFTDCNSYVKPSSPVSVGSSKETSPVPAQSGKVNGNMRSAVSTSKVGSKQNRTVSWNREIPPEKLSFTMRREFDRQKEESELIGQLRKIIETRLKISLPEDIAPALTDGVVLCHLANHVRPRSVASIHVPSPAVPKLTMARCRRNVDNFLEACRKIGVDDEWICSCADIVPPDWEDSAPPPTTPNPSALFATVAALVDILLALEEEEEEDDGEMIIHEMDDVDGCEGVGGMAATNTNQQYQRVNDMYYEEYFKSRGIHFPKSTMTTTITEAGGRKRKVPQTLDLFGKVNGAGGGAGKAKIMGKRMTFPAINELLEECEYDSDIGKFNCRQEEHGGVTVIDAINDLSTPSSVHGKPAAGKFTLDSVERYNLNKSEDETDRKIVMKRIEFFEKKVINQKTENNNECNSADDISKPTNQQLSTYLCLGTFFCTILFLVLFPLPN
ncbi:leucine-rich repeat and calponin homology domain-containing protein [Sergentomyia squamirostris]